MFYHFIYNFIFMSLFFSFQATDKNKKATIIILPQERSFSFYSSLNIFFKQNFKKFNNKPIPHKRTNLGDLCF